MFDKISISLKTFLRDEFLFAAIHGINKNYPGAQMVIVDDGEMTEEKDGVYADLHRSGHITDILPFDSGFGRKSNRVVELYDREYLLIGSDDFYFDKQSAEGVQLMQHVLDTMPAVSIVSGRVNGRRYEFDFEIHEDYTGTTIKEVSPHNRLFLHGLCVPVDLTANFSLIRMRVFDKVGWDNDVKIGGGEHGAFFYDCKKHGICTVFVPGIGICEQSGRSSSRYQEYRRRANSSERPCFKKRGIVEYILADGRVDWKE